MASMGIHLGGNRCLDQSNSVTDHLRRQELNLCTSSSSSNQSGRLFFPAIGNCGAGRRGGRSASLSATARASLDAVAVERRNRSADTAAYEKVEAWMRDSVTEIVKNLREAPLLVHVYGKGGAVAEEKPRLETERAVEEENWEELRRKWEGGVAPYPDGVIFVEEVMDEDVDGGNGNGNGGVDGGGDGITRLWGLVVQGKGQESGPACYLLKTTSGSGCGLGMGLGCTTHFCLLRVNGFRETAQSQLKNCWLLQAQAQ